MATHPTSSGDRPADAVTPATVVHLVERVRSADRVYETIRGRTNADALLLDLTAGRLNGLSQLESARLAEGEGAPHRWAQASDFARDLAEETRREYVRWVAEAGRLPLVDGESIQELFTYRGELSLWWITQASQRDQDNTPYRWFFYAFAVIDRLLETGEVAPDAEWHLWVPDAQTGEVLARTIGDRGRVVVHADATKERTTPWRWTRRHLLGPARQLARALYLSNATRRQRDEGEPHALFGEGSPTALIVTVHPRSWTAIDEDERFDDAVSAFDRYFGTMPWDLRAKGFGVAWLTAPLTLAEYREWVRDGLGRQTLPDATPWAYLDGEGARALAAHHVTWLRTYRRLFTEQRVQDQWQYRGIPLGHWIVKDYNNLLAGWANALLIQYEQKKNAVDAVRPDAVIYRDEMYVSGRIISAAAGAVSRLIGVQHGIIHSEETVYTLDTSEVDDERRLDHVHTCPVPDVFATFGDHTGELIERADGYPSSRVLATGGVRHDELVRTYLLEGADRTAQRADLRRRFGLPVDRPVVLLCTQRKAVAGDWFDLVVRGLKASDPSAFIAVKTHHYHGGEAEINRVAESHQWTDYELFEDHTYPLISCADVVVGGPSTIILEARLLDVPAVSISDASDYETYPYIADAVGEVANSASEMAAVLGRLLADNAAADPEVRTRTLKRHLWNDDARACDRLAEVIEDQIAEGAPRP